MKVKSSHARIVNKKETRKTHLKRHIKSVQESQKIPCSHCGTTFTQKGHLQTHKITTWRSKDPMPTLWIKSKSEVLPSDTHKISPWRSKVSMPTLWIQSNYDIRSKETDKISTYEKKSFHAKSYNRTWRQKIFQMIWLWKNILKEMLSLKLITLINLRGYQY